MTSRYYSCCVPRKLAGLVLVALLAFLVATPARSAVIYESATLGTTGPLISGLLLNTQFGGSRFSVSSTTHVTGIGGHLAGDNSRGTIWGAIVPMSGLLPSFPNNEIESNALGSSVFTPPFLTTAEIIAPLSLTLAPGDYALLFGGGGFFGTTGVGFMPTATFTGATDLPAGVGSYFFGSDDLGSWNNGGFDSIRFLVEGDTVPEPTTLLLLGLGLAGLGFARKRLH